MVKIDTILKALSVVPAVTAALPEFKRLFDQLVATFDRDQDQETLRKAYDLAISDADDAHNDLQALIRERTGQ